MIRTLLETSWLTLRRDRVALLLTFVVPVVFFSIFVWVFSDIGSTNRRLVDTVLVTEDGGSLADRLAEILQRQPGLELVTADDRGQGFDRTEALELVRTGAVAASIVIPEDFSSVLMTNRESPTEISIYADTADVLTESLVSGWVQAALVELGYELIGSSSGPAGVLLGVDSSGGPERPVRIRVENVMGGDDKDPAVAFFAAGIGVMFLLFALSGRSAILIDERETGVLSRLLTSRLTLRQLILGRWLFLALLGVAQVSVMFIWGAVIFDLDLFTPTHLLGFFIMTTATASTAAGFALLLASTCTSRAQLNSVSSVVVLVMSVLGGSMFPRFLMPDALQRIGLLTFNAWALDGFQKVFWYEASPHALWPQVTLLVALALVFIWCAYRLVAIRITS